MRKALIVTAFALALCGCDNTTYVSVNPENEGRFKCEYGEVNIVTDTRTGVQYLAWSSFNKGGICVLVDKNGKPLLEGDGE